MTSRKAFERYMYNQKIERGQWHIYWPIWKAGAQWQKKQP